MGDMPRWNAFIKEMLERRDKPDKGNTATFVNKLTSKKENIERKAVDEK